MLHIGKFCLARLDFLSVTSQRHPKFQLSLTNHISLERSTLDEDNAVYETNFTRELSKLWHSEWSNLEISFSHLVVLGTDIQIENNHS
jgi:hypothetical protein